MLYDLPRFTAGNYTYKGLIMTAAQLKTMTHKNIAYNQIRYRSRGARAPAWH